MTTKPTLSRGHCNEFFFLTFLFIHPFHNSEFKIKDDSEDWIFDDVLDVDAAEEVTRAVRFHFFLR